MTDFVTLNVDAPNDRLARIHEALRDLGLELCSKCHVWKGIEHFDAIITDSAAPPPSFSSSICLPCSSPLPLAGGVGGGSSAPQAEPSPVGTAIRCRNASGDMVLMRVTTVQALATAAREVAR